MKQTHIRLDNRGIAHLFLVLITIVMVGVIGTYFLVASHADSLKGKHTSTYYLYSAGGKYTYARVSSSGFSDARCGTAKLKGSKKTIVKLPGRGTNGYPPLALTCVTPVQTGDSYSVTFLTKRSEKPTAQTPVLLQQNSDSCVFVHSNDAPTAKGITHVLTKNADGSCNKDQTPDTNAEPEAPAAPSSDSKPAKKTPTKAKQQSSDLQKTDDGLVLPPNFSSKKKNKLGYFLLPASPGNKDYYIHTNKMPGGESVGSSPNSHRYGTKEMIGVFYSVALAYHAKYSDSKLVAGDINAHGHTTHRNGIDMDIYTSDHTAALRSSKGGSDSRSLELAKMLLDTGRIKFILFNDPQVRAEANAYAASKHLPGKMLESNETHDFHFHFRVNSAPGPCAFGSASECSYAKDIFSNEL